MWSDTVESIIQRGLLRHRNHGIRPDTLRLHPLTWHEIAVGLIEGPTYTFQGPAGATPTLFGMRVIEDATLPPGTWRLD